MTLPLKVIEVDVPDCFEPYNYMPVYLWSGFLTLLILCVLIGWVTYWVSTNRKERKLAEIRNRTSCPNCFKDFSAGPN